MSFGYFYLCKVVFSLVNFRDLSSELLFSIWCFYISRAQFFLKVSREITTLEHLELTSLFMLEMEGVNVKDYSGFLKNVYSF